VEARVTALPASGARFYRCALQVNPFDYLGRHKKKTSFTSEAEYNAAIVKACHDLGIEVIAVTDHFRIQSAVGLMKAARDAGMVVFPGFEAATKEGIHFLCVFEADREIASIERIIGDCGVHDEQDDSPTSKYDVGELLEEAGKWGAACIAAHVAAERGLLTSLQGQARSKAWKSERLLACSLPGPVSDAPESLRPIIENKNADYRRDRRVAVINAQDASGPDDLTKPGASCWIKMSNVSVEGLRQAFLDPGSRIRLASDAPAEEHSMLAALAWEGGFLDGVKIAFNENLNVLIGGRGTGKSTIVESIRYVLGLPPLGEEACKTHDGIVKHVLSSGTKISLALRSHHPGRRDYRIERTVPNPPVVRDEGGKVLSLSPSDLVPGLEVFGQHEISELTKSPEKLTRLLERFVELDASMAQRKMDLRRDLERSRTRIQEVRKELHHVDEQLGALPRLEETLKRFKEVGLEHRLKEQTHLVREEGVLNTAAGRFEPFRVALDKLRRSIPIDLGFLGQRELEELPAKETLADAGGVLSSFEKVATALADQLESAIKQAESGIGAIRGKWDVRKAQVKADYEKILRELQKEKVDGAEFLRLQEQIEELRPLKEKRETLVTTLNDLEGKRRTMLAEWEDAKSQEFRSLDRAGKMVNKRLAEVVRVRVAHAGNREPLAKLLREQVGGRLQEAIDTFTRLDNLSLKAIAEACVAGKDALMTRFKLSAKQAEALAGASPDVLMQIEELDLPATTTIELNVAAEGQAPVYQTLDQLSKGQKATAVLMLLLLESEAPLVVDQPEDDLDNRFITEGVVPRMREEKRRRQFIFSTHNANIPVLGDAELIVGLSAVGEAGQGRAEVPPDHVGSIDSEPVRELVEELLEGGRAAFEMRRLKYGF
jgi:predicted ATPase